MRQGITVEFGISRSRLRQIWYKCPLQKKIEGSQQQSMAEAPSQALHELIDLIYRKCLSLTITSNFSLKELEELERLPPSVVRRIDGMCRVLEV